MKKLKKSRRNLNESIQIVSPPINLAYNKYFPAKFELTINYILAAIAVAMGLIFLFKAKTINGYFCFPLDDSWIHLTFARNLVDYGSFSYYKNQLVTSGSTSPLYTFILAALYSFSKNEFIISYVIGISSFALSVFFMFKLAKLHFVSAIWLAFLTSLLLALQSDLNLIAVSGMETTMFIALIIISLYNYQKKSFKALGICLGLLLWCRPDGLILWVAILGDYFIGTLSAKSKKDSPFFLKTLIVPFSIAGGMAILYFLFNVFLSGSIMPNTFASKIATYGDSSRIDFLKNHVMGLFTAPEFVLYFIPFLISVVIIIKEIIQKKYFEYSVYLIFLAGLIFVYWLILPFSSSYGRYLMPLIPFYIIMAVHGVKSFYEFLLNKLKSDSLANFILAGYFIASIIISIIYLAEWSDIYSHSCKYYNDRHVAAGKWIFKNTPPDAVVATHDIGAIEYYGKRKLLDMVGLVSPEIIDKMKIGFITYLNNYLIEKKPDYIVTLKNWFEIVNDNPVYSPVREPEILEIYKFKPNKTHILSGEASAYIGQAIQYMNLNDNARGEKAFLLALAADPASSKTNFILAYFYISEGFKSKGEEFLSKALSIFPEYADANFLMGRVQYEKKNYASAKEYINKCLQIDPAHKDALELLEILKKQN
ncbi:MAG: tetratricopeptide repeat protein [Ignavibacteriaceae bacterium]|nr:tetratricopeptide repeat protein [Ignavibacteriaceae bacterium]